MTVVGPAERFFLVEASPGTTWVGVRFRPGMAGPCLRVSPSELLGREIPASDCSPHLGGLLDQISARPTPGRALTAFARSLPDLAAGGRRGGAPARVRRALELFESGGGAARVSAVARAVGVTERTLHRDVLAAAGLPPKALARVFRLRRTVALLRAAERPDLCAAALEGGYADQPHMTREFRALAGLPPAALLG